ncbi:hypothetical protein D3C71_1218910 [compost metagenome]
MALQRLELPAVLQADDEVGRDGLADRHSRLGRGAGRRRLFRVDSGLSFVQFGFHEVAFGVGFLRAIGRWASIRAGLDHQLLHARRRHLAQDIKVPVEANGLCAVIDHHGEQGDVHRVALGHVTDQPVSQLDDAGARPAACALCALAGHLLPHGLGEGGDRAVIIVGLSGHAFGAPTRGLLLLRLFDQGGLFRLHVRRGTGESGYGGHCYAGGIVAWVAGQVQPGRGVADAALLAIDDIVRALDAHRQLEEEGFAVGVEPKAVQPILDTARDQRGADQHTVPDPSDRQQVAGEQARHARLVLRRQAEGVRRVDRVRAALHCVRDLGEDQRLDVGQALAQRGRLSPGGRLGRRTGFVWGRVGQPGHGLLGRFAEDASRNVGGGACDGCLAGSVGGHAGRPDAIEC